MAAFLLLLITCSKSICYYPIFIFSKGATKEFLLEKDNILLDINSLKCIFSSETLNTLFRSHLSIAFFNIISVITIKFLNAL